MIRFRSVFSMAAAILVVFAVETPAVAQGGSFVATGDMVAGRAISGTVRLADGRVFTVGGIRDGLYESKSSAEVYDPATGTWSLAGTMSVKRAYPTANLLPDGRVLVSGGAYLGTVWASTEIWDPATGLFSPGAPMSTPRFVHIAVTMLDGRVLVAGGSTYNDTPVPVASAEIYDPSTNTWAPTGSMLYRRNNHVGVLLADGRVFVGAGDEGAANGYVGTTGCQIFDPATGVFTAAASMSEPRGQFAMVRLSDGRLLAAGGNANATGVSIHSGEIYDPAGNSWSSAGTTTSGGASPTLTLLADGRALATGGQEGSPVYSDFAFADIFDPATGTFSALAPMHVGRAAHSATLLPDGNVVIAGGMSSATYPYETSTSELFVPATVGHPPTANAGADQTVECAGPGGSTVTLDGTGSTDPDGDALTYGWNGPFGTAAGVSPSVSLSIGVSTITLTVTDAHGASATDTLVVTVQDTTSPAWTSLSATPNVLGPPNHKMVAVVLTGAATDACDASPALAIASVTSNEPVDGPGDWVVTGAMTLNLRAERLGNGSGRIYTITVRATDASGNSSLKTVTVTVPKGKDKDDEGGGKDKHDEKEKDDDQGKKDGKKDK